MPARSERNEGNSTLPGPNPTCDDAGVGNNWPPVNGLGITEVGLDTIGDGAPVIVAACAMFGRHGTTDKPAATKDPNTPPTTQTRRARRTIAATATDWHPSSRSRPQKRPPPVSATRK